MFERLLALLLCAAALSGSQGKSSAALPPAPTGTLRATEKEVAFLDGESRLRGTLHMPVSDTGCPAVVVLGGAERGPRVPVKRILAGHFADAGIAALIYDSPGTGQSSGNALFQTKRDRVKEALAAHRFLEEQQGIRPEQVGIFGISEGAGIALLAAAEDPQVAFVMAVSGALGIPPMEVSRHRIEMMGLERGLSPEEIQKALALAEIIYALLAGPDIVEWPLMRMKVKQWPEEPWNEFIELTRKCRQKLSADEQRAVKERLRRTLDRWKSEAWFSIAMIDTRRYERFISMADGVFFDYLQKGPLAAGDWHHSRHELRAFARVRCPVLAIWGERDRFVPPGRSAAVLTECIARAQNEDVTIVTIPGASHRITVPGEGLKFAGDYPGLMVRWVLSRFPVLENQ